MQYPYTKTGQDVDILHGHTIPDPYRWLEDTTNTEVKAWVKEQNTLTQSTLKQPGFNELFKEIERDFRVEACSTPVVANGKYFFLKRNPEENQLALYWQAGMQGKPVCLYNPNTFTGKDIQAIETISPSKNGTYVAVATSVGGTEMSTIRIYNTEAGTLLEDTLLYCRNPQIDWLPDESGFFYTHNPRPGTVPQNEEHLHIKVSFHKLGTNQQTDELVFGNGRPKDDMLTISLSGDAKWLVVEASETWTENDIFLYEIATKQITPFIVGRSSHFSFYFGQNHVFIHTNDSANNYRVLSAPYQGTIPAFETWTEFLKESKFPLEHIAVTKEALIAEYIEDAATTISLFDFSGNQIGTLPLPTCSSLRGLCASAEESEFFYGVNAFTFPLRIYRANGTQTPELFFAMYNPLKEEDYETTRAWATSKDGTNIPLSIVAKKSTKLNGNNPTILYAYGGFGITMLPFYLRAYLPWITRGGIFVVAHIRGGKEYGETWHTSAIKLNIQKRFDDFIGGAETLINLKYTSHAHLGILGGSNGGLLVNAVGVQRPNLFQAVCPQVPLTDMVRFPQFLIASRWVHEYGDPANQQELESILRWSPYHNIKEGQTYPSFLNMTAESDTRVSPLHAWKMTARLQAVGADACVFTEEEAGHGAGKPINKIVETQSLVLAFFGKKLGIDYRTNSIA